MRVLGAVLGYREVVRGRVLGAVLGYREAVRSEVRGRQTEGRGIENSSSWNAEELRSVLLTAQF